MSSQIEVAIIGAGPYGLSLAAHLSNYGVGFRIFGKPMNTWISHMPAGMHLKSEGFASTLYAPHSRFTYAKYCKKNGITYADLGHPVALENFATYGVEFHKRLVPSLEKENVVYLGRTQGGFRLSLADGSGLIARRVVVATGISHYQHLPPLLADMPEEFVSHTSRHSGLSHFKGREVIVIGGGASAVDVAGLLHREGVCVQLVARKNKIEFHTKGRLPRPLTDRIRAPLTCVGGGWKNLLCTAGPMLFRQFPDKFRIEVVRRHLGPAPGYFMRDMVVGKVPMHLGLTLQNAAIEKGRVHLEFANCEGKRVMFSADHVIAGTGYRVDITRLPFLDEDMTAHIAQIQRAPRLSSNFESSVRGLYFVGPSSASSFGPLVRFACGAEFTVTRLSRQLASLHRRKGA